MCYHTPTRHELAMDDAAEEAVARICQHGDIAEMHAFIEEGELDDGYENDNATSEETDEWLLGHADLIESGDNGTDSFAKDAAKAMRYCVAFARFNQARDLALEGVAEAVSEIREAAIDERIAGELEEMRYEADEAEYEAMVSYRGPL